MKCLVASQHGAIQRMNKLFLIIAFVVMGSDFVVYSALEGHSG